MTWLTQFLHPGGAGYWFWSGIGSGSPLLAVVAGYWHHHNCHQTKCWRLGHPDPDHGQPVCKTHNRRFP